MAKEKSNEKRLPLEGERGPVDRCMRTDRAGRRDKLSAQLTDEV